MALPSNSAFNNKYVEVTAEQMNITKDQIKNNQMIGSTDKYQSAMVDNLKDVLKKSDNSDFEKGRFENHVYLYQNTTEIID